MGTSDELDGDVDPSSASEWRELPEIGAHPLRQLPVEFLEAFRVFVGEQPNYARGLRLQVLCPARA